jgi:hypothetical protein
MGTGWNRSWVGIATGYGLGGSSSPGKVKNFLLSTASTPVLEPTQPRIQWAEGAVLLGGKLAEA